MPSSENDDRCRTPGCYYCYGSGDWTKCPTLAERERAAKLRAERTAQGLCPCHGISTAECYEAYLNGPGA